MFSGLVEATAEIARIDQEVGGIALTVQRPGTFDDVNIGDSIAIQGCCLTIVQLEEKTMGFQAGRETLSRTTLGNLSAGSLVNCERSLRLSDRIGGHIVSGHVDGMGRVVERRDLGEWSDVIFEAEPELTSQMAVKGSVAIDGVSLTLVRVEDRAFSVALIPLTLAATNLGNLKPGSAVNLETDLLAKYVQRQIRLIK